MGWWIFDSVAVICVGIVALLLVLILFEPGLRYRIKPRALAIDSAEFLRTLSALCDAEVRTCEPIEVLNNGENFYKAELAAIASATKTVHLEAYIFERGKVAQRFIDALAERARAGVRVKVVVDAIGSLLTPDSYFKPIREAGGQMVWYQPLRPRMFKHLNNRTHRKLIVVDGTNAFCGGADIGDEWHNETAPSQSWRDTVFRFHGDVVTGLQSTFAENWLEASGEILADGDYFPETRREGRTIESDNVALVVNSTPSAARGTRAHILYQTLLAFAGKTIDITTPYFLPDRSTLSEIVRAVRDRGVKVRIITPGKHADHLFTRASSRRLYGELIKAGAEIYEYRPTMIHAKTIVIDGLWSIVGSTNFDNRSMGLNDEVNVAVRGSAMAGRLLSDFEHDLKQCRQITLEMWESRSLWEKLIEPLFRIFDRQF